MDIKNEKQKLIYQINHIEELQLDKKVQASIEEVIRNYPDVYTKIRIKEKSSAIQKFDERHFNNASEIGDLLGVMIITKNIDDIYRIKEDLSNVFKDYTIEDYIIKPKFGYQSLHMNCIIEENIPLEIQIKTEKMKIAQELVHDSIYKNSNLDQKVKNILSYMAYSYINRNIYNTFNW